MCGMYCKYKDAFGPPREGNHKLRDPIFDTALNDVIMTVVGAFAVSWFMNYRFGVVLLILFIIGIILHRTFCVRTTVDKFLFPNAK
jgi:hypothetical protein